MIYVLFLYIYNVFPKSLESLYYKKWVRTWTWINCMNKNKVFLLLPEMTFSIVLLTTQSPHLTYFTVNVMGFIYFGTSKFENYANRQFFFQHYIFRQTH